MKLDNECRKRIIHKAVLARLVEEKLLYLYSQNRLNGTIHTCIGEEFTGAVVSEFIEEGDTVFSNHRCHGHYVSIVKDVYGLIAEIMGKETGTCGGRGGSQHLCKNGFYSNGIQGGTVPVATGLAMGHKIDKKGKISVAFIGDGTLGQGTVYESLNVASKWNLPLLVLVENNKFSQSTSQEETLAGDILKRAEAFGVIAKKADTWNWENLYDVLENAITYIREESRPVLVQIDTFRLKAHSKGDDNRPRELVESYEKIDPLNQLMEENSEEFRNIFQDAYNIVERAVEKAEKDKDATEIQFDEPNNTALTEWIEVTYEKKRVIKALNQTMKDLMMQEDKMIFYGEDVMSPYGGAFKVSAGLSDLFPDRVFNTPISEPAIVGIGCGLALKNYKPFVEIMFGDFITLGFDQILNHASKFRYMYNNQVKCGLVVRTPMGGGRAYGPTHSQTLEKHFFGIPGLRVVAWNNFIEPKEFYDAVLNSNQDPTLVIENKILYGKYLGGSVPDGFKVFRSDERFPSILIQPETNQVDVTIISYGGYLDTLVDVAEQLFDKYDIKAQIICPSQIFPCNFKQYVGLLNDSRLIAIVEEGQKFAGFGSEVLAQLSECSLELVGNVIRIAAEANPIPTASALEKKSLPGIDTIISSILGGL